MHKNFKEHLQSTIDGIVRGVHKHNTGKTAAWSSASHVEKAPKKKDTP